MTLRRLTDAVDSIETKVAEDSLAPGKADEQQGQLPEINFSTFVISLSTQALMHLGEIANPLTGKIEPDRASGEADDRYHRHVTRKNPR